MSCGCVGHFPKMCRTKGKPPKKEEAAGKDTKKGEATDQVNTKKTSQQVEAAWGYPDGNWACQVDLEQKFELPGSINLIENKLGLSWAKLSSSWN